MDNTSIPCIFQLRQTKCSENATSVFPVNKFSISIFFFPIQFRLILLNRWWMSATFLARFGVCGTSMIFSQCFEWTDYRNNELFNIFQEFTTRTHEERVCKRVKASKTRFIMTRTFEFHFFSSRLEEEFRGRITSGQSG